MDDAPIPKKPLRLWPGIAAVVLLILSRFGVKAAIPGFTGFEYAMLGALGCAVAILLWWLFFSRASWLNRIVAFALMPASLAAAWFLRDESMGPAWLFAYAVPFTLVAFVAAVWAARNLSAMKFRLAIAAAIIASSLAWTLMRSDGIDGDHVLSFYSRWSPTPEQLLLAKPLPVPAVPIAEPPPAQPTAGSPTAPTQHTTISTPDWPGFRGPNRDGVIPGVKIAIDWAQSPPDQLWRKPIGPAWSSFAVQDGLIYTQEQRGEEELVTCYRAATGEPVWAHADPIRFFEANAGPGPRATPTLANGRVYTLGATGHLNALDARTGQRIWSRDTAADTKRPLPDWGFSASPIVTNGLVIVYTGRLAAYDAATGGAPRWLGQATGGSYSSPQLATIRGVEQILLQSPQGIQSLHPASGKLLWSSEWKGLPIIQPAVLPGGGILFSASQASGTRRIHPTPGPNGWTIDTRWTSLGLKPYFNDTVIHKGHAYGFDSRILACINLETGQRVWKGGRYGNGQMLLLPAQDLLLILSEDGELALVQATPTQFTELAKMPALEGKTWNHPVLAAGLLLIRNAQEMAAFRLPFPPQGR